MDVQFTGNAGQQVVVSGGPNGATFAAFFAPDSKRDVPQWVAERLMQSPEFIAVEIAAVEKPAAKKGKVE